METCANPYLKFANVVANSLLENIYTTQEQVNALQVYTTESQSQTYAWTDGNAIDKIPLDPNAPGYDPTLAQFRKDYDAMVANPTKGPTGNVDTFIDKYCNGTYIYYMSQAFGSQMMGLITKTWDGSSGSTSSAYLNKMSAFTGLITSTAQQMEQIGQNGVKTEGSVVQNTQTSNPETFNELASTVNTAGGNIANLLASLGS